ncbi:DinB family protein [Bacillus sp. JJ664]
MKENIQIRNELFEAVGELSNDQLNKKVNEDQWSIMQVLDHLFLMEAGLVKIMNKTFKTGPSEEISEKPIQLTLDRTRKFNAPNYFVPTNDFVTLEEMKQKLSSSRNALHTFVEETKDYNLEDKGFPHPAFGQMNLKQWIPFIGLHEKRHLEQINDIKNQL